MRPIDLPPADLDTVRRILRDHAPGLEARAFGSRVSWTARDTSDLDLVLMTETPLDAGRMTALRAGFTGSSLPFRVDVADWAAVSGDFRAIIEREYVVLRRKTPAGPTRKTGRQMRKFGDCAELVRSAVSPASMEDTPYVGLEHIGEGTLSILGHGIVRDVKSPKYEFRSGDILFGKLRPYFRKVVRPNFDGVCSTDIWVVRAKKNIDQVFLYYTMANPPFVDFATNASEGTKMPRAKWDWVSRYEVRLPPLAEQRAIAEILSALDDKIELNRCMNETLEAMARAIFDDWFVDFGPTCAKMEGREPYLAPEVWRLFPDSLSEANGMEIPTGWRMAALPEIVEINPKRQLKKGQLAPYLDMAHMPTKEHAPSHVPGRPTGSGTRFANGDTLLARITPCLENGKTAYVDFLPTDGVGWGSTEYIVLRPRPPLPDEFAYCLARNSRFREFAIQSMTGTSGRQRVPPAALSKFVLPVPPTPVAEAFGRVVRPLLMRAGKAVRESVSAAATRDALLPRLLSGQLGLGDAEKAAA